MTDDMKCAAMIEMLEAFDAALAVRAEKWMKEANGIPRVVLSPREGNRNKKRMVECRIRVDEIVEIRKLVMQTVETCKEQIDSGPVGGYSKVDGG